MAGYQGLDFGSVADRLTSTLAQGYKDREELSRERDMAAINYQRQQAQFAHQEAIRQAEIAHQDRREDVRDQRARDIANLHYGAAGGRSPSGSGGGLDKFTYKQLSDLNTDINPYKAKGGGFAKPLGVVQSSQRLDGLFKQFPDLNIPAGQTVELATAVAGLISGGSPQSQHQIDLMVPNTMRGKAQDIASWVTGNPVGREQQAFMQLLKDTSSREKEVAVDQIRTGQIRNLGKYQSFAQKNPVQYEAALRSQGLSPEILSQYSVDGQRLPPKIPDEIQDPRIRAKLQARIDSGSLSADAVAKLFNAGLEYQKKSVPAAPIVAQPPGQVVPQAPITQQPSMPAGMPPPQRSPSSMSQFNMPQSQYLAQSPTQSFQPNGLPPAYQGLSQTPYSQQSWDPSELIDDGST